MEQGVFHLGREINFRSCDRSGPQAERKMVEAIHALRRMIPCREKELTLKATQVFVDY